MPLSVAETMGEIDPLRELHESFEPLSRLTDGTLKSTQVELFRTLLTNLARVQASS